MSFVKICNLANTNNKTLQLHFTLSNTRLNSVFKNAIDILQNVHSEKTLLSILYKFCQNANFAFILHPGFVKYKLHF